MLPFFSAIALFAFVALAAPEKRQTSPSVKVKDGTVVGTSLANVENFKGIPFAQPPVGNLRLKPPQPLNQSFGTITSDPLPKSCPQFIVNVDTSNIPKSIVGQLLNNPILQAATHAGEDCLTINVQRPAGTKANSKLPVLFWIYGGGFELGSTQMYDGTSIITKSVSLGKPIIFVAVNYRLGGFGFLAGDDLSKEGSTNLGLRDQRFGMQWVQDNIASFGGDPSKVTIWGESAGSISVFDHTVINDGDNAYKGKPLFRGAIMNSGSVIPALQTTSSKAQATYDTVVEAGGCSDASDKLQCLRALSYEDFLNAATSVPSLFDYQSVNIAYLPRPDSGSKFYSRSPELSIYSGKYTKVPIIIGDQEDEGTLFSLVQSNVTTTDQLVTYLKSYFNLASRKEVAGLVKTYPDDASAGSPYHTGPLYNIYPQFKRLAAILGDLTFTLTRRTYLHNVASSVPTWSYLATYLQGTPVVGTLHGSDILQLFFNAPFPIPTDSIQTYYVSFVNFLDPNKISTSFPLIKWPRWTDKGRQLLNFKSFSNSIIKDDFREKSYQYVMPHTTKFRI